MQTKVTKMKKGEYIFFSIYTFILMFAPPIIPRINLMLILTIFSIVPILLKKSNIISLTLSKSYMSQFIYLYMIFLAYSVIVFLISAALNDTTFGVSLSDIYKYLVLVPAQLLCVLYLIISFYSKDRSIEQLFSVFIGGGLIECVLGMLAFVFTNVKTLFIDIMVANTGQTVYFSKTLNSIGTEIRYFGFANTLLDSFGYCVGSLAVLALILGLKYKSKYFLAFPLFIFLTAINSRTGLLIALIGALCIFMGFLMQNKIADLLKIISLIIIVFTFGILVLQVLKKQSPLTYEWITSGFTNIFSTLMGQETQTYDVSNVLFSSNFWSVPSGLSLIFGKGYDINTSLNGFLPTHSDVGYINQLWQFGIIGTILVYIPYANIMVRGLWKVRSVYKSFLFFMIVCFFVVMIKFDATNYTPGSPLLFVTIFYMLLKNGDFDEKNKHSSANL